MINDYMIDPSFRNIHGLFVCSLRTEIIILKGMLLIGMKCQPLKL